MAEILAHDVGNRANDPDSPGQGLRAAFIDINSNTLALNIEVMAATARLAGIQKRLDGLGDLARANKIRNADIESVGLDKLDLDAVGLVGSHDGQRARILEPKAVRAMLGVAVGAKPDQTAATVAYGPSTVAAELDRLEASKADILHAHNITDVEGLAPALETLSLAGHGHPADQIEGLGSAAKVDLGGGPGQAVSGGDQRLHDARPPRDHRHPISEVDGLGQLALVDEVGGATIAPDGVGAHHLAPNAVGAKALAPAAVFGEHLAPKVMRSYKSDYRAVHRDDYHAVILMEPVKEPGLVVMEGERVAPLDTGFECDVVQYGVAPVTLMALPNVTANGAKGSAFEITKPYGRAQLLKVGADEWLVSGDIRSA